MKKLPSIMARSLNRLYIFNRFMPDKLFAVIAEILAETFTYPVVPDGTDPMFPAGALVGEQALFFQGYT